MGHCLASRALLVHQNSESQVDQGGRIPLVLGRRIQKLHGAYTQSSSPSSPPLQAKVVDNDFRDQSWKNELYRRAWAHAISDL